MRSLFATGLAAACALAGAGALAGCTDVNTSGYIQPCRSGVVCTWAGTGDAAFNGDGLDRVASALYWPMDLDFAPDGRAYVLDWQNHRVRRVNADNTFETVVGTDDVGDGPEVNPNGERTPPGVAGTTIDLNHPTDVAFSPDGTIVVAAWHNHKIRHYDPDTGLVDVTCGAGPGYKGDGSPAVGALMNRPKSVAIEPGTGTMYVVDTENVRVRRISGTTPFNIDTVVGNGTRGFAGDGGDPLKAELFFQEVSDNPEPGGAVALDASGRLYIVDTENQRVRRVDLTKNLIETVAGNGQIGYTGDGGPATDATLNFPRDAEIGPDGRLYIADTDNQVIRAVDLGTGIITTVAGNGHQGFAGDGAGPLYASFNRPFGIAFDAQGSMYVADTLNNRVRKVQK
jgi:sugar lactone lactonase YvrE